VALEVKEMKQKIDINALSDKQLLLLEKLLSEREKKAKTPTSGSRKRRRPRERFKTLKPQPSDVLRCIAFERAQDNPNAVSDGYKRAKIELVERIMDSEQTMRRMHSNLAQGRLNHGNKSMARSTYVKKELI
tara:strand:+ start:164 stop:559 length:396 start_codon:yes stop_codon:yes gene_type:complete